MTSKEKNPGSSVPPIPQAPDDRLSQDGRSLIHAVYDAQQPAGERKGIFRRAGEVAKGLFDAAVRGWRLGRDKAKAEAERRRIRPIDHPSNDRPEIPEGIPVSPYGSDTESDEPKTDLEETRTPEQGKHIQDTSVETTQERLEKKKREALIKLKKAVKKIDKYGLDSDKGRVAAAKAAEYSERVRRLQESIDKETGEKTTPTDGEDGGKPNNSEDLPMKDVLIDHMQERRQTWEKLKSTPGFKFPGGEIGKNRKIGAIKEELDAINEEWDRLGGKAIDEAQAKGLAVEQKLQEEIDELEARPGFKFPSGEIGKRHKIEALKDKLKQAKAISKANVEIAKDAFYARFIVDRIREDAPLAPTPTAEDFRRARIDELDKILEDPDASESDKYTAAVERERLLDELNDRSDEGEEGDDAAKTTPDDMTPEDKARMDELEKRLNFARSWYAELRARYEQLGFVKKLIDGKSLKEEMEKARAGLEEILSRVVYHQVLGWENEKSVKGDGQEKIGKETIQAIALATLNQQEILEKETQERYDRRLEERSGFKKVAAKIGRWFVGEENKESGKLGLGGWLRSGGAGLVAGVVGGLFRVGFPIGVAGGAGVRVAAHQRALENSRGEDRSLDQESVDRIASVEQDRDWTVETQDKDSGKTVRRDASEKEITMNLVGRMLAETQRDTEERQRRNTAIARKAVTAWSLGFAAGVVTVAVGRTIRNQIANTLDKKPANIAGGGNGENGSGSGSGLFDRASGFKGWGDPAGSGAEVPGDITEVPGVTVTPPPEISLGSDGWVWDRVADVLGAEKATPFLEQLAQTNPDFQLIDLPNGLTGIAYQGNTDPQVVADAIGKVAPDLLKQWVLKA